MTWRRCRIHWWCPKNCDAVRIDDLVAVTDEAIDLLHDVYTAEGNEEWFDRRDALFARAGVARQPKGASSSPPEHDPVSSSSRSYDMSAPIVWVLRRTSDALYTVSSWFSDAAGSLMSWSNRIVEHKRVKGLS